MISHRVELTPEEFHIIQVLIKTQRFNPDPVLKKLRTKFLIEEGVRA